MKYFLDTEFIERFHKPLFGKARHVIDLISIAIVAEDGRKFYAISNEYRYDDASNWVKENVIRTAYLDIVHGDMRNHVDESNFQKYYGYPNKGIAAQVLQFIGDDPAIEFYGYYSDYDWVLFCSLFGTMMQLPSGFPMYCRDLKQTLDECGGPAIKAHSLFPEDDGKHIALNDAEWIYKLYNFLKQLNRNAN